MSGNVIANYECNVLVNSGKKGELVRDASGYFEFVLGAFNILNARGEFYPFTDQLKALFGPGGDFHRRVVGDPSLGRAGGKLKGEFEHPTIAPGQSLDSFIARWKTINTANEAVHIKSVRLEWSKDHRGQPIVLVYGMIKGSGPHGEAVDKSFANCEENVAMSGRYICNPVMINGIRNKMVTTVITFDKVNEGGIAPADKYNTPTMETIDGGEFTLAMLEKAERSQPVALAGESSDDVSFTMIKAGLGWQKTEVVNLGGSTLW